MSDENFHHYLALTGEITFNLRNSLVSFYFWFGLMITIFNIYPW
jgi:hypothetical protein